MKFDSYDTEQFYYKRLKELGVAHVIPTERNKIFTMDDVVELTNDLEQSIINFDK